MAGRLLAVLTLAVVIGNGNGLSAQQGTSKVGDQVFISMTGDLAKEYARCAGSRQKNVAPNGLQIETSATIVQKLADGRVRIEHTLHINLEDGKARLVTLTGTVDSAKITTAVTPKGAPVSASPGAKSQPTPNDTNSLRLTLSDLTGLKLRTWTLSEEIGQ